MFGGECFSNVIGSELFEGVIASLVDTVCRHAFVDENGPELFEGVILIVRACCCVLVCQEAVVGCKAAVPGAYVAGAAGRPEVKDVTKMCQGNCATGVVVVLVVVCVGKDAFALLVPLVGNGFGQKVSSSMRSVW